MKIRNIVKDAYGDILIISKVTNDYVNWIYAKGSNMSGRCPKITTEELVYCGCDEIFYEYADQDCPHCKGTGQRIEIRYGMDKATILADNMFDYIKDTLMKNFDF